MSQTRILPYSTWVGDVVGALPQWMLLGKREAPQTGGARGASRVHLGTCDGGGKTPSGATFYTPADVGAMITNQQFIGAFCRAVITSFEHCNLPATLLLFVGDDRLQPEVCPFWAF